LKGNQADVMPTLMSFGIPTQVIPMEEDGQLKRKSHLEWIAMRRFLDSRSLEDKKSGSLMVTIPSSSDILFGRGKGVTTHPGNIRLSLLLESQFAEYENCGRRQKTAVTERIAEEMKTRGGRFLKKVDGIWREVDDSVARAKISHDFRTLRSYVKEKGPEADKNKQGSDEETASNNKRRLRST
jgi:hypothetical protein